MRASSQHSKDAKIKYGIDGLAPIYLNSKKITTSKPIPLVCGPTMEEVAVAICAELMILDLDLP